MSHAEVSLKSKVSTTGQVEHSTNITEIKV